MITSAPGRPRSAAGMSASTSIDRTSTTDSPASSAMRTPRTPTSPLIESDRSSIRALPFRFSPIFETAKRFTTGAISVGPTAANTPSSTSITSRNLRNRRRLGFSVHIVRCSAIGRGRSR